MNRGLLWTIIILLVIIIALILIHKPNESPAAGSPGETCAQVCVDKYDKSAGATASDSQAYEDELSCEQKCATQIRNAMQ